MKPGYAYHYTGARSAWKTSPDDEWDTEMQSAHSSSFVGTRRIDGSACTVWEHDGELYAQTAVMAPAPRGGGSDDGALDARNIMRSRGREKKAASSKQMDPFTLTTLGLWERGNEKIIAAYMDVDAVRVSTVVKGREGSAEVLTERKWLERYDKLRDGGWTRA